MGGCVYIDYQYAWHGIGGVGVKKLFPLGLFHHKKGC